MRCPNCSGERIVLASSPGEQPARTCVCLGCAHLWEAAPDRTAAVLPGRGRPRA